mgnify:CR=1 FL=1
MRLARRCSLFLGDAVLLVAAPAAWPESAVGDVARPPDTRFDALLDQAERDVVNHRPVDAVRGLRQVLKEDPDNRRALFLVSNALNVLGHTTEALTVLEKLVASYPDDFSLLNNLAWLLVTVEDPALRDPRRAVGLARRSLMIAPENFSVWSTLSEAYYRAGDYPRALQAAEEALRLGQRLKAPDMNVVTYEEQVTKCRNAVQAFSLRD